MLALLKGNPIIPLQKTHSEVPGKTRAGGQSSVRFARLREGAAKDHFKKIAEYMKNQFLGMEGLKGIIIGGPGVTVNDFINKEYLTGDVKKKIIGVKDLSYTDEFGLQELLDKSQDILAAEEVAEEKKVMNKFFELLAKKPGMVTYGEQETMEKLKMGAVDLLLVSEAMSDDIIDKFEQEAKNMGTEIRIVSVETREGVQLRDMGGVAAILRYEAGY
jgi:peptide chain release factor subunit 1